LEVERGVFFYSQGTEKGTLVKQDTLCKLSPIPSTRPTHPPLSRLVVKLDTPMYYSPTYSTAEICVQQCSFKTLTNYSKMLTVQTITFNNKTPCTLHSAFMCPVGNVNSLMLFSGWCLQSIRSVFTVR
jgi:hypothetical protein